MSDIHGPCISCGLLSRIAPVPNLPHVHLPVTPEARANVELAAAEYRFDGREFHTNVQCFLRCAVFGETIDGNALRTDPELHRRRLAEDRGCVEWVPFVPGLNPKEHWERQQMINWREMDAAARAREKRTEKRARKRERRMERSARRRELLIVIALTAAQLIAAGVTAYLTANPGSILFDRWIRSQATPDKPTPQFRQSP